MLESVTAETFQALKGSTFTLHISDAETVDLELVAIETAASSMPSQTRAPFRLTFASHEATLRPQGTYAFSHPSLETLQLFTVPSGRTANGFVYCVSFN
jgi:hypothetical protein